MITVSAPTKLILIGEHAILYGSRGICVPLGLRTVVKVSKSEKRLRIDCRDDLSEDVKEVLLRQIDFISNEFGEKADLNFYFEFNAPPGLGFGVSASIAVALTKAICEFYSLKLSDDKLFEVVKKLENENHGKSSGIDHSTIIFDTPILFEIGEDPETIKEIQDSAIFENCYVLDTGKPKESTKEMVEMVAGSYKQDTESTQMIFSELDGLAMDMLEALRENKPDIFAKTVNRAGVLLEKLNLVCDTVKKLSEELRELGASVKISGAGGKSGSGSGALLVYHQNPKLIEDFCQRNSLSFFGLAESF